MARDLFTLGLGVAAILLTAQALRAEPAACTDRATMVARLAQDYGETRQMAGLAGEDRLLELFASPQTGSWTLIVTLPTGVACLYAAGVYFERFEAQVPDGDPA